MYIVQAISNYGQAYAYYSRYDIGPILLQILIDMSDLYYAAFTYEEDIFHTLVCYDSKSPTFHLSPDIIKRLLGGSYVSLLDTRFACTDVVIERYKTQMNEYLFLLSNKMYIILMKICHVKYYLLEKETDERVLITIKSAVKELISINISDRANVVESVIGNQLFRVLEGLCKLQLFQ